MDRSGPRGSQHRRAMRADGDFASRFLLHTGSGKPGEPEADALAGRAVHAHTVLWSASDDVLARRAGLSGERQEGAKATTADGTGSDLSEAAAIAARSWTSDLSLSSAWLADRAAEPSLGERHHLYPPAPRVYLPGGHPRLVQPLRSGLGGVHVDGECFLFGGAGMGLADGMPGNFQHGPGGTIHQRGFYWATGGERHHHQHGWTGTSDGQHFRGATMAQCEVRRSVSPRLRAGRGCGEQPEKVFLVLQSRASASVVGLSDAGHDLLWKSKMCLSRAKTGGAMSRARCESSLLGVPEAKFFGRKAALSKIRPRSGRRNAFRKRRASPEMGVGEGVQTPPLPLQPHPCFNSRAEKDEFWFTHSGQRSTLERPNFCLNNGEHLTADPFRLRIDTNGCCRIDGLSTNH